MEVFNADLKKADDDVAADHAADPAHRVRRAGRRRHPAAAGDHRRRRRRWASSARSASSPRSTTSINHVILLIGLAVGVDYSLFYLRRVREERAAGRSNEAAIEAAAATSGRAVLISGITVMIAMAGHVLRRRVDVHVVRHRHDRRRRRGHARLAHRAARACCRSCGDRVDKGRIPGLDRLKRRMASFGLWSRVVDRVMRRPLLWAVTVGRACCWRSRIPALHMDTGTPGDGHAPAGPRGRAEVRPPQGRVPERDLVAQRRRQGQGRHRAGRDRRRSRTLEQAAQQHQALFPGDGVRSGRQPRQDGRHARRWTSPATARTTTSEPGARRAARRPRAGDARQGRRASRPTSTGGTRGRPRLQRRR